MDSRSKRSSRRLVPAAIVSATLTVAIVTNTKPASSFEGGIHERITRNALTFIWGGVLDTIVAGNLDEDQGDEKDFAERHGSNCRFRDSADYVNMRYRQVVDALREPQTGDPNRAARLFGHILHGIQDFYSHSNWIPKPPEGLGGPRSATRFRSGIVAAAQALFATVRRHRRHRRRSSRRCHHTLACQCQWPRLVCGAHRAGCQWTAVSRPDDLQGTSPLGRPKPGTQLCPPVDGNCKSASPDDVCLRHGDTRSSGTNVRAFDGEGRMNLDGDGGGDWFDARHHARLQTRHEWCRLLHLSRGLDPTFVASGRLLGTWVKTDTGTNTPHIP
jgi:hypothetical protein